MELEAQLPDWLKRSLSDSPTPGAYGGQIGGLPIVGDLFVIKAGRVGTAANRLGVVLDVDASFQVVRCALLTTETEYACDRDVRLTSEELQLPYAVIVECDIVTSVWWNQVGPNIGAIPAELRSAIIDATTGDFVGIEEWRRGTPIHGPDDPRWSFREQELSALHALSSECLSRLTDGLIVDPALIASIAEAEAFEQRELVAALCDRAMTEIVAIDASSLELLCPALDSIDYDAWNALQPLIESASESDAITFVVDLPLDNTNALTLRRSPAVRTALESIVGSFQLRGVSIVHLLTRYELWGATLDVLRGHSDHGQFILVPEMLRCE